jgi:hypothetical protein
MTMLVGLLNTLAGDALHEPTSLGLKPLPVIVTAVPAGPLFGVRVIVGAVAVTVKVA